MLADLRGYGDSSKPPGDADHANYSKRAMAHDMLAVMRTLGHERFAVLAHDRGARVAHRLAADHSEAVTRMVVLDIAPTLAMYEQTNEGFARAYWHWFFLIQPAPLPERLIEADPVAYLRDLMGNRHAGLAPFDPRALAEYERCVALPGAAHGLCEDYRAAAGIDLEHDRADREQAASSRCRCSRCGANAASCTAASSRWTNGAAWPMTCKASRCRVATTSRRKRPTICWRRRCRS